ncbi:hypothetical protein SS209_03641 [Salmonella enterica subsp. enterica serovar Senftenberg str. SS209]|nr:hypothetical protein SS209_03641 [Salmonella enterica subsp. enterica serovar Senftenberg str. SS209]
MKAIIKTADGITVGGTLNDRV